MAVVVVELMSLDESGKPTLRCMECWQKLRYSKNAPYQAWDEPCEHLLEIGRDIRKKLKRTAKLADEAEKKIKKEEVVECQEKLF